MLLLLHPLLLLMLQPPLPLTARKQQHQHKRKQIRQPQQPPTHTSHTTTTTTTHTPACCCGGATRLPVGGGAVGCGTWWRWCGGEGVVERCDDAVVAEEGDGEDERPYDKQRAAVLGWDGQPAGQRQGEGGR